MEGEQVFALFVAVENAYAVGHVYALVALAAGVVANITLLWSRGVRFGRRSVVLVGACIALRLVTSYALVLGSVCVLVTRVLATSMLAQTHSSQPLTECMIHNDDGDNNADVHNISDVFVEDKSNTCYVLF